MRIENLTSKRFADMLLLENAPDPLTLAPPMGRIASYAFVVGRHTVSALDLLWTNTGEGSGFAGLYIGVDAKPHLADLARCMTALADVLAERGLTRLDAMVQPNSWLEAVLIGAGFEDWGHEPRVINGKRLRTFRRVAGGLN